MTRSIGDLLNSPVDAQAPLRVPWRRLLVVAILAFMVCLERIDVALSGAHKAGAAAGAFGDIATPARVLSPEVAVAIADGWHSYSGVGAAGTLMGLYAAIDILLMLSIAVLLSVMCRAVDGNLPGANHRLQHEWLVVAYLVADFVETSLLATMWAAPLTKGVATVIAVASLAKWTFLLLATARLAFRFMTSGQTVRLGRDVLALRGQLLVVLALLGLLVALTGPLGRQIDEVMVLAAENVGSAGLALVLGAAASIALGWGAAACARAYRQQPDRPDDDQQRLIGRLGLVLLALSAILVVCCKLLPTDMPAFWYSIGAASGIAGVLLALQWVTDASPTPEAPPGAEEPAPPGWLYQVVADVPLLALFLAIVRAATTAFTAGQQIAPLVYFGLWTAFIWLVVHVVLRFFVFNRPSTEPPPNGRRQLLVMGGAVALWVAAAFLPLDYTAMGTPAIVMLFAFITALLTTALALISDRTRVGGVLDIMRVHRLPVFMLLLVWALAATAVDAKGAYYAVRTLSPEPTRETLAQAFKRWQPAESDGESQESKGERRIIPMVFVTAAGGGIRAAYWTGLAMGCTFGTECENGDGEVRRPFLASGVSGGALGLASYRYNSTGTSGAKSVEDALSRDFIAPTLAAFLFRDVPNSLLRLPGNNNRADILEQAWEGADPNLASNFGQATDFPRLLFNSTSVEDGCRLVVSEVRLDGTKPDEGSAGASDRHRCEGSLAGGPQSAPGAFPSRDAFDYLCAGDAPTGLRVSTAVMLAARFPYVSPAGGLGACKDKRTFALDGGLIDNSGATAIEEAWTALAPAVIQFNRERSDYCITPRLLVLDNEQVVAGSPAASPRPMQMLAPLESILGGFGRRSATPIARTTELIKLAAGNGGAASCGLTDTDPVAVITPGENPGPGLPLGWTLSKESRQQMRCLLAGNHFTGERGDCQNPEASKNNWVTIERVRSWFDKDLIDRREPARSCKEGP